MQLAWMTAERDDYLDQTYWQSPVRVLFVIQEQLPIDWPHSESRRLKYANTVVLNMQHFFERTVFVERNLGLRSPESYHDYFCSIFAVVLYFVGQFCTIKHFALSWVKFRPKNTSPHRVYVTTDRETIGIQKRCCSL